MDEFCSLLNGDSYYDDSFDKYEFDEDKAWTAQVLCFSVGELEEKNYKKTCFSTVLNTLKGFKCSIKEYSSTYENSETPILYLSLSKKFKGQDYLVLSKLSAEAFLKCKDDKEQKSFIEKSQVVYDEKANCFGVTLPPPIIIGEFVYEEDPNYSNIDASTIRKALYGYTLQLKQGNSLYEDSDTPILFLSLSKEFKRQDYLVLSKLSAEAILKCNNNKERKEFLGTCKVKYSKEADCYGVILPDSSITFGKITF